MHVVILNNPTARAGAHRHVAEAVADRLRERGIRVAMISGGSADESTSLLRAALAAGPDALLVAGGDGTVGLALQELAGTDVPLGIIPTGTGNDLATAIGLHELDPGSAADAVAAGRTRRIDLARVTRADGTSRLYGTVLASGFDAKVNDRANAMRCPRGAMRYNIAILIEFVRLTGNAIDVELELPDGSVRTIAGPHVITAIGNGPTYGGGIPICPDADLSDGLLDVTLIRPAGRLRLLRLLPRVYRGTHTTVPEATTWRARRVTLRGSGVTAYADGDPLGPLPVTIDPVPTAVRVFAPS
ncbi:diacylglycerol kinase [Microbacterium sp. bgisy189]|uniref:diacylglycerol kinase n=1 Tax=Microbacterium sp. bgisy189 TaxID=3413798 RepID=UPI003EBCB319